MAGWGVALNQRQSKTGVHSRTEKCWPVSDDMNRTATTATFSPFIVCSADCSFLQFKVVSFKDLVLSF